MLRGIVAHLVANLVVQVVHQPAFLDGQYLVEGTRDVETDGRLVFQTLRLVVRQRGNFLVGQIALVGASKVQLVAVFLSLDTSQDGAKFGQLYLADACQLVKDLLLLHAQLFVVGNLLPLATAAHAEVLAERLGAHLAVFMKTDDFCFHERVLLTANLQVDDIARHSPRYKHHHLVNACHRFSFGGIVGNGNVFKYR